MIPLPCELWDAIVAHVVADEDDHSRWRDLARLSWTCRGAYRAAHRPLWRHLRLVFRINGEWELGVDPDAPYKDQTSQRLELKLHTQVYQSSVFPRFTVGQVADKKDERYLRIRQVSKEYVHLQPFVVLDGTLFLASLLENERSPGAPDMAGIVSLWGSDALSLLSNVRVVGGLVLFPYPLQLVQQLTIDALGSYGDLAHHEPVGYDDLTDFLPFLFAMDSNQIRDFSFYTSSGQGTPSFYIALGSHFVGVANHDYFFGDGTYDSPTFCDTTRSVRVYNCGDMEDSGEEELCRRLGELPNLTIFDLSGRGSFCVVASLFSSPSLTRLTLNYILDAWRAHDPFPMHLQSLKELTLNFEMANLLFNESHLDSMFSPASKTIFPVLTHLTFLTCLHGSGADKLFALFLGSHIITCRH